MAILLALIPAVAWGSIGLISGKLGGTSHQQTLGMTMGAVLFGLFAVFYFHPALTTKVWIVGIISGIAWAVGQFGQFQSMKLIGISTTVPVSTGLQLIGNALAGVLLFHEWTTGRMVSLGTIALILLIAGAALTSFRDRQNTSGAGSRGHAGAGAWALTFSTLGYVTYTIVVNYAHVPATQIIFPQSIGMLIGASAFVLFAHSDIKNKATLKNIITGLVWGIGNFFMFMAIPKVGLAISYSLAQMGIVISTFGSIFLLGEHKTRREMVYITIGSLLVIGGGVILGIMK